MHFRKSVIMMTKEKGFDMEEAEGGGNEDRHR